MSIHEQMKALAGQAKNASRLMAKAPGAAKDKALTILAGLLHSRADFIAEANAKDLAKAESSGMDSAKLDRLRLSPQVLASMAKACLDVAAMTDPVGAIETMWQRPNGLMVGKMRIPLGVVCMIYESRPNVTVDSAVPVPEGRKRSGSARRIRGHSFQHGPGRSSEPGPGGKPGCPAEPCAWWTPPTAPPCPRCASWTITSTS